MPCTIKTFKTWAIAHTSATRNVTSECKGPRSVVKAVKARRRGVGQTLLPGRAQASILASSVHGTRHRSPKQPVPGGFQRRKLAGEHPRIDLDRPCPRRVRRL